MSVRGREIEVKLLANVLNLEVAYRILQDTCYPPARIVKDTSTDTYWHLSEGVRGDFIRMRELGNGRVQVTVKGVDREAGNLDRIELELETNTRRGTVKSLLTAAHGRPAGTVTKTYYVLWPDSLDPHTNISCYHIEGDPLDRIYIEVESDSLDKVLDLEAKVCRVFTDGGHTIERASGSLYELYIPPRR